MEAIVSGLMDSFRMSRKRATALVAVYGLLLGAVCSLGFGVLSDVKIFGFGILDFLDFISNNVLLPLVGMFTCIVIGFVTGPAAVTDEEEYNGRFRMKGFYVVMVKCIAPVFIFIILISSILQGLGILKI